MFTYERLNMGNMDLPYQRAASISEKKKKKCNWKSFCFVLF
jgi:hypothetical protein